MKYAVAVCMCCLCVILIVLAVSTRTLVDSDSIRITQNGHRFAVYDLLGGKAYNLKSVHKRLSEGQIKPAVLNLTDTIRIDRIQDGFQVVSNGKVYQITRNKGGL